MLIAATCSSLRSSAKGESAGVLRLPRTLRRGFFAVPFAAFQVDTDDETWVLDVDKETLENAEGFDKDDWPSTSDLAWLDDVYAHYRVVPFWASRST